MRTDRNGIVGWSDYWPRDNWYPSLHVVIRNNLLEDIGGDGIVPIGCDGCIIEHNTLRGGRTRAEDYAAGIWPWSCDNTVVQYNEVSGMVGTKDGQGFDADWNCRNTIIQYNYSHDNEGGFILLCESGDPDPGRFNDGAIVRYNISQNDGARIFQVGGKVTNARIYNNVIYVGEGKGDPLMVLHNPDGMWPDGIEYANNIFYDLGRGGYELGQSTGNTFTHNVFFGTHAASEPEDAHKLISDPMFEAPGTGGLGLNGVSGYRLRYGSPCADCGLAIPHCGGRDYWGNPVPAGGVVDRGAQER